MGLELDRLVFIKVRNCVNYVIEEVRRDYYMDFINENSIDQRWFFNVVNSFFFECNEKVFLFYICVISLVNDFGEFFYCKIVNICVGLGINVFRIDLDDCLFFIFKGMFFLKFNNILLVFV